MAKTAYYRVRDWRALCPGYRTSVEPLHLEGQLPSLVNGVLLGCRQRRSKAFSAPDLPWGLAVDTPKSKRAQYRRATNMAREPCLVQSAVTHWAHLPPAHPFCAKVRLTPAFNLEPSVASQPVVHWNLSLSKQFPGTPSCAPHMCSTFPIHTGLLGLPT